MESPRPADYADPKTYDGGEVDVYFDISWSTDESMVVLEIMVGNDGTRFDMSVHQIGLLREFLNANIV